MWFIKQTEMESNLNLLKKKCINFAETTFTKLKIRFLGGFSKE